MFKSLNELTERLEDRIGSTTRIDIRSLCLYRIVFCAFSILFHWPHFRWIGTVPDSFFYPPPLSVVSLMSGFPPEAFFLIVDIGVTLATLTLMIGLFTRWSTVALLVLLLIGNHFRYSFGKIDHDILYLAVLFVMAFKDWGRFYSLDALRRRQRGSGASNTSTDLRLLAVFLAFGFFAAGFPKALNWIDFDLTTSGVLKWLYGGYFNIGRDKLLASAAMELNSPWFWELLDFSACVFELGFLVALFWRRSWYLWLAVACGFHLMNCLMLNITFLPQVLVYAAFLPWSRVVPAGPSESTRRRPALVVLALLLVAAGAIQLGHPSHHGIIGSLAGWSDVDIGYLLTCAVIWSAAGLALLASLWSERRQEAV